MKLSSKNGKPEHADWRSRRAAIYFELDEIAKALEDARRIAELQSDFH